MNDNVYSLKKIGTLPYIPDRLILSKIWMAINADWDSFPKGREPYADHVFETLCKSSNTIFLQYEDGQEYLIPENPPDPKTIGNFINLPEQIITNWYKDVTKATKSTIKTSNETINYIHAYLFCKNFNVVSKWKGIRPLTKQKYIVKKLDNSFELRLTYRYFPKPFYIFIIKNGPGYEKNLAGAVRANLEESASIEEMEQRFGLELLGVLGFFKSDMPLSKVIYIPSDKWKRINGVNNIDDMETEKYGDKIILKSGNSVSFLSKNLHNFDEYLTVGHGIIHHCCLIASKIRKDKEYLVLTSSDFKDIEKYQYENFIDAVTENASFDFQEKRSMEDLIIPLYLNNNEIKIFDFVSKMCS